MDRLNHLAGWFPIRLYQQAGQLMVDGLRLGDSQLDEPFFQMSIQRLIQHPFHQAFRIQVTADELIEWASTQPPVQPSGLVFHASRCGSTLVPQMLGKVPGCLALSEPPLLDSAIRLPPEATGGRARHVALLRALVTAWTTAAWQHLPEGTPRSCIIKTDAWSILSADLLREAWPDTPWVLMYRHPVEIAVSQIERRAAFLMPGTLGVNLTDLPLLDTLHLDCEEYVVRSVGTLLKSMVNASSDSSAILVNHMELPDAVEARIAPHFCVPIPAQTLGVLRQTAMLHAKEPQRAYLSDSQAKQLAASEAVWQMVEQRAMPAYCELEARRLAGRAVKPPAAMPLEETLP